MDLRKPHGRETFGTGAGALVQRVSTPTALVGDPGSIPSTYIAAHNCLSHLFSRESIPSSGLHGHQAVTGHTYTHTQAKHS